MLDLCQFLVVEGITSQYFMCKVLPEPQLILIN